MTHPANLTDLVPAALEMLRQQKEFCISLVQRKFKLPYADACELARLVREQVVRKNSAVDALNDIAAVRTATLAARIVGTALFFRDLHEIGEGGDTRAIALIQPWQEPAPVTRKHLLEDLFATRGFSLSEICRELALTVPEPEREGIDLQVLAAQVAAEAVREERPIVLRRDASRHEKFLRSVYRFAVYIKLVCSHSVPMDTRSVDHFVQRVWIPTGTATPAPGLASHDEHVVPCVLLILESQRRLQADPDWPTADMAEWLRRYLAIVTIHKEDARRLDGPMGLKMLMPEGWNFETGCIYARLHRAGIAFTGPAQAPCTCG